MPTFCGDAAHATGGVSGQGVNSALVDSAYLADCLLDTLSNKNKNTDFGDELLRYSQHQVPERHALYRLSFPPSPRSALGGFRRLLQTALQFTWGVKF